MMTNSETEQIKKAIEHLICFRFGEKWGDSTDVVPPSKHIAEAQEILEELISNQEENHNIKNLVISKVEYQPAVGKRGGAWLEIDPPLVLFPRLKILKNGKYFIVEDNDWQILAMAATHKQLLNEVKQEIRVMWDVYATADDESLTKDAKKLKYRLLSSVTLAV